MRNVILGTVAGLVLGTIGALAYSHYLGDGSLLSQLQSELDNTKADLAKMKSDKQALATESTSTSDQINALLKSNEELKKELEDLKKKQAEVSVAAASPALTPATIAGMVMGMMRGGGFATSQRMVLLKNRLNLTADQEAAIKAAMDSDNQLRRQLMRQMFQGGKIDPADAAKADTLDQTLTSVLTQQQQAAYQQVEADEKSARADTQATIQVDQVAPLLQLSDSQREQVYNALYQVQSTAPDPTTLLTNPNAMTVLSSQAQATQDALAKVLTPTQMTLYEQQMQATPNFGRGRGR